MRTEIHWLPWTLRAGRSSATKMQITFGRVLGLLIAITYVVIAIVCAGLTTGMRLCLMLLLPMALIWFPDELGNFTGYVGRGGNIDQESPPIAISMMGWFFLVGLPLLLAYIWR